MTREEALKKLIDIRDEATAYPDAVCYVTSEDEDALNVAIEALNSVMDTENDTVKTENDVIKRQDAIKTVCRTRCGDKAKGCPAHSCSVIEEFDVFSFVELKTGEWVFDLNGMDLNISVW